MESSRGPHPTGPQNSQMKPIRRALKRKRPINTDLCNTDSSLCLSFTVNSERDPQLPDLQTVRQSVSGERHSPNRSRDSCTRADSGPNNASFTQVPRGKCGQHNARSEVAFLVGPTLVVLLRSLRESLAPASDSRDGRGDPALRAGKPHAAPASPRNGIRPFWRQIWFR